MGFFSDLFSAIGTFATRLWQTTKEVVARAVGWLADKAEVFVGKVAQVWKTVKEKYVAPALAWARQNAPWPWLKKAISIFEEIVLRFEHSPFGQKLKEAIEWTIQAARDLRTRVLSAAEVTTAQIRKALFGEAVAHLTEDEIRAIRLAERINDYVIAQSLITHVLDTNEIGNFEHYLRLRAAQKLLQMTEQRLAVAQTIDAITPDDHFLLEMTNALLEPIPLISDIDANRLDSLVRTQFGRGGLLPFVFEEMVIAWNRQVLNLASEWSARGLELTRNNSRLESLEMNIELELVLSDTEKKELTDLQANRISEPERMKEMDQKRRELKFYVDAAEGFLQVLEGRVDDKEYIANEAAAVGKIIIECAQHGRQWSSLEKTTNT